jgi:hypothetical protein
MVIEEFDGLCFSSVFDPVFSVLLYFFFDLMTTLADKLPNGRASQKPQHFTSRSFCMRSGMAVLSAMTKRKRDNAGNSKREN